MSHRWICVAIAVGVFGGAAIIFNRYLDSKQNSSDHLSLRPSAEVIHRWGKVDELPTKLAIFKTVFWEPKDTLSLRSLIAKESMVKDKSVLEIGVGTGLISLCCCQYGARSVVASDINSEAIRCAEFNASQLGLSKRIEFRKVTSADPAAYSILAQNEKFDVIISNPPWEDGVPQVVGQHALYDPGFKLLESLIRGLRDHLTDGGEAYLVYGCRTAIAEMVELAEEEGLTVTQLDARDLKQLPEVFLPGMLFRVTP